MIRICGPRDQPPKAAPVINVTSRSNNFGRDLSPFFLGPVSLFDGRQAKNVENAWQYSKVYPIHADGEGDPTGEYFRWSNIGFAKQRADRYPMGKGARPLYSYYKGGVYLGYIEARAKLYVPLYRDAAASQEAFLRLLTVVAATRGDVWLWDFDGYDHVKLGMSLEDVLNCEKRKMGHAFVLAMMLSGVKDGQ